MSKETEKIFSQMNKYMEQFNFDSEEQMEKEMKNFIQKLNNNEIEFDDPKFKSDDLLEGAYNTSSKTKAIKLAKQALEINPENIDAECFIAEFEENQIKNEAKVGIDANDKKEYGGCGNLYRSCGNSERNSFYYSE